MNVLGFIIFSASEASQVKKSMALEHSATKMVNVHQVYMVKPATPTPHHFMFLSEMDLFWLPVKNVRRVLFYKTENNESFSSILETLKRSLSDVLVDFYPVAGRLSLNKDTNRSEIECNDAGVEVTEATIDTSFEEIEANNEFANRDFCNKLAPPMAQLTPSDSHPHSPLLSLQVTGFTEGGFCIGIAFQHAAVDGHSFWHFMNSWAELCRGMPGISTKPIHDRAMYPPPAIASNISYRAFEAKSDKNGEAKIFKFVIDEDAHETTAHENGEKGNYFTTPKPENLEKATFSFSMETIRKLKEEAEARSSFAAVAAHSWRSVLRARGVPADEHQVDLGFMADCRGRVKPRLPYGYFGNFLSICVVKLPAKKLFGEKKLSFVAKLIEEAVETCATEEQVRFSMAWGGETGLYRMVMCKDFVDITTAMGISGSNKFPVYECDFGWGMPVRLEVSDMNEVGSIFLAPSPPPNHHNDVHITSMLPEDESRALVAILSGDSTASTTSEKVVSKEDNSVPVLGPPCKEN